MSRDPQAQDLPAVKAPFCVSYAPEERADSLINEPDVLAVIRFTDQAALDASEPRAFSVGLEQIGGQRLVEVWRAPAPIQSGFDEGVAYARSEDVLLGHILLDEGDFTDLEAATEHAYRLMRRVIERHGYDKLLRVWNYFPDINLETDSLERYRAFSRGRHSALEPPGEIRPDVTGDIEKGLPAASALGTHSPGLQVYFLTAREPGVQIENPRQVSAFHYPPQYGPSSPLFSRATFKRWGTVDHFYISGTASIVGHESRHAEQIITQLDETLTNIQALIDNAHAQEGLDITTPAGLTLLKVYIRGTSDLDTIRRHIKERIGASVPSLYLQGDICRGDLIIEIEGIYTGGCETA